ncbi:P-loop containing nucleoside triphosphate hydrolase protein [Sporormia fimetaria CBS 119925]|uniref:P-loop containing nucleoside triphosphate hydrolase protein n=1 Tax=Sporormia fimetaria CBS 119925 TaxID=1340428 RepID=A0A6A6V7X3_9PLEO|nr:P-loop containing nucleoside triphosphate hydrolase protein [Sporormia fimetaria CBS 119925]
MLYHFLELIEGLKNTTWKGWTLRGIPHPESVSDHMYRMAVMCLLQPGIDDNVRTRAIKMCLIHDMGEAITGDITPSDGNSKEGKFRLEEAALKYAAFRQIDKLECIQQATVYAQRFGTDLREFMQLQDKITGQELQPLLKECLHKDEEFSRRTENSSVFIFISGGFGVGKGTQCSLLAKEMGLHHISVGDLLRGEAARTKSSFRDFIPESIQKSILLPPQLTTQLLQDAIAQGQLQGKHIFLLDGFPRYVAQLIDFEDKISKLYATISLNCIESALVQRLRHRSMDSRRVDDNQDSIIKRLHTFNANNAEVLSHLANDGQFFDIESSGSVTDVYEHVRAAVEEVLHTANATPAKTEFST